MVHRHTHRYMPLWPHDPRRGGVLSSFSEQEAEQLARVAALRQRREVVVAGNQSTDTVLWAHAASRSRGAFQLDAHLSTYPLHSAGMLCGGSYGSRGLRQHVTCCSMRLQRRVRVSPGH